MTIPVFYNFVKNTIFLLSLTATALAFFYTYASKIKSNKKE